MATKRTRTYYLLQDRKTIVSKRPDTRPRALTQAEPWSVETIGQGMAYRCFCTRYEVDADGRFGNRLLLKGSQPYVHPPKATDPKIHREAEAMVRNEPALDLQEILDTVASQAATERRTPEPGVLIKVGGVSIRLAPGSQLTVEASGELSLVTPGEIAVFVEEGLRSSLDEIAADL